MVQNWYKKGPKHGTKIGTKSGLIMVKMVHKWSEWSKYGQNWYKIGSKSPSMY